MTAQGIQRLIHKLDSPAWKRTLRIAVLGAAVLYVAHLWLFKEGGFRGLAHEKAMDQAQVAREIARGHGFATRMIRPAALWQLERHRGAPLAGPLPDTRNAPLHPLFAALLFRLAPEPWLGPLRASVHPLDRLLAAAQLAFFLLAVFVSYRTARRLFDQTLAVLGAGLLLACGALWDWSMSGLPQMLMLFLFSAAAHATVRMLEARESGKSTLGWSAAAGVFFGLLTLTHGLAIFLLAGAVAFTALAFRPRGRDAAVLFLSAALVMAPWLIRNVAVTGNPSGLAVYAMLSEIHGSEARIMRMGSLDSLGFSASAFFTKARTEVAEQLGTLPGSLGGIIVAPVFFLSLLHQFRRPRTALFRWWVLAAWLSAVLGMALAGLEAPTPNLHPVPLRANDLHVLFIPLMTCYGLAYVLVQWARLEIRPAIFRKALVALIFLLSAFPFVFQVLELQRGRSLMVHWPPYLPPSTAMLSQWTNESEIIMSDMPWAVAWYADRRSLWLPESHTDFHALNDYRRLGASVVGLYLTPVTGDQRYYGSLVTGEYAGWGRVITRQFEAKDFDFPAVKVMPVDAQCVFYADHVRWDKGETPPVPAPAKADSGSNAAPADAPPAR
jgi:GNAT superfamily N-acetyltransferase